MKLQVLNGDAIAMLKTLPSESVQCCVTSPPYWGLRDYGVAGQIGLEKTPSEFIEKMVEVFREVRRVLKPDGTLWMNLGDSYAGSWGAQGKQGATGQMAGRSVIEARQVAAAAKKASKTGSVTHLNGLKAKDLAGIPWRVAFALQSDGWWLRSDIIWHKPNPMPESITDRPTKAHEYIFLLTKSERYHYDAEAIKEPASFPDGPNSPQSIKSPYGQGFTRRSGNKERKPGSARGCPDGTGSNVCGSVPWEGATRNKRTVWTVSTSPYTGAHFATFPPDLIRPCILAGSRPGDTVLDPFGGSGTTGAVSIEEGRNAVLIELNPEYVALIHQRCSVTIGLPLSANTESEVAK